MEKSYLKHVLVLLDHDEIRGIDFDKAVSDVFQELHRESSRAPAREQVRLDIQEIIDASLMKRLTRGYDVTPNATIFARSAMHSQLEDLSLLACMLSDPNADPQLFSLLEQPCFAAAQIQQMVHPLLFSAARQCHTFIWAEEEMLAFPDAIREDCLRILSEYRCANPPLVSPTALCHYLKTIYPSSRDNWKNQDSEMIPYRYQKEILRMLPRRGIPCSRDESKQLQSFYKDTLFHEYDHRCPICGIDLPHMLIGSHIKPFRDCAHLYEPIDNNNGMLLCRNHDYLFDQGYISFNAKGRLLVCQELRSHAHFREVFCLPQDLQLEERLMSEERKLFFAYHREHIFRR